MSGVEGTNLMEHFSSLEDSRRAQGRRHNLLDIVAMTICAVVAGTEGWDDVELFTQCKAQWFRRFSDLPKEFGNWNTVHRRWVQSGVFQRIFDVIEEDLDLKAVIVDGTFAKVHQHGARAKKAAARLRSRLIDKLSAAAGAGLPPSSWRSLTRQDAWSGSP